MNRKPNDRIPLARLAGAFGVHGEIKCDPSNAGRTLFIAGAHFLLTQGSETRDVVVSGVREHKGRLLLRIEGIESMESAQALNGAELTVERERIELAPDEYLDEDLVGLELRGVDGRRYGSIERVEHWPSSDMLVVGGRMVPMVRAIVREIDLRAGTVTVDPPLGLLDGEAAE
ncbi:MAG: ribosome maturation factor RimM [Candidatus Baltobacteraceae bacterium]